MINSICKILGIARRTYFHWQKSDDKSYSINLFNKYFTKDDLQEFINHGTIHKLENINHIQNYFLKSRLNEYTKSFNSVEFNNDDDDDYDIISDFYFYFLSNLKNDNSFLNINFLSNSNCIDNNYFIEALSSYISQIQSNKFDIDIFPRKLHNNTHSYKSLIKNYLESKSSNESYIQNMEDYIKETIKDSEINFNYIFNNLSFIQNWDNDMLFFIDYLIQTDFELFINSNNDKLLYHAIGYLVYSNMHFDKKDIFYNNKITVVNEIYEYFINNKNDINKELIKDISFNLDVLFDFKKYKEISEYFKNIKRESSKEEIYKIISSNKKYNELLEKITQYNMDKFWES